MQSSKPAVGVMLVLAAAALWGSTGTAQSLAGGHLSASWFGALRLSVASAFFAGCALVMMRRAPAGGAAGVPLIDAFGAGICMAVYNLAFFAGIRITGVALGTAIALGSGPIWAGVLQATLQRQRPTLGWWAGTLVAVSGGALMTLGADARYRVADPAGLALCLLSGLSYAVYTLLNRRMAARGAAASAITLRAFSVAAAIAVPAAWFDGGAPALAARDVAAVLYTGIVTAGVPYLLFSRALRHIAPATGVTLALGEPVVACVLAVALLGERPTAVAIGGLLLVVAGVLLVVRQELGAGRAPRAMPALVRRENAPVHRRSSSP